MTARKRSTETLRCSGEMTIRTINAMHQALRTEFQKRECIVLEVGEAGDVDLTFVQMIEAARLTASRQSKKFTLAAPAAGALLDVLKRGGFADSESSSAFWLHTSGKP